MFAGRTLRSRAARASARYPRTMPPEDTYPTISEVLDDGTLIELIYAPSSKMTALAVASPDGAIVEKSVHALPDGRRLVPYSATNNLIATGCVLLPSSALAVFEDQAGLIQEVQAFVHRYVDLSPVYEAIAAHYVLLSWVYDAFNEMPYLRFRGDFGTGKTRALLVIGSISYKPFFASGASTVSPIFHVLEAFRGTLILDEADLRFSDATADLTKLLNNGNVDGLPILRTMTNRHKELNPRAFRVFGPKIIGMRQRFSDVALESRFLTEETGGRALRADIPIDLPAQMKVEAMALRNKLLAWRFAARFTVAPDRARLPAGLTPRAQQSALPLLSLVEDAALREEIAAALAEDHNALQPGDSEALERQMIIAVIAAYAQSLNGAASVDAIAKRFNDQAESQLGRPMPNRWVGGFLRTRFNLHPVKSHGVSVLAADGRIAARSIADRLGLGNETPGGSQ
jgi:hypothetical protein